jgi:hypothetical protein
MILILLLCMPPQWIHDFISLVIQDSPGQKPSVKAD